MQETRTARTRGLETSYRHFLIVAILAVVTARFTPIFQVAGLVLGIGLSITAVVFFLIMLWQAWAAVQAFDAKTTPGRAVGFLFIPFYNFYWVFVAYWELARTLDRALRARGRASGIHHAFALAYPIAVICLALFGAIGSRMERGFGLEWSVSESTTVGTVLMILFATMIQRAALALVESDGAAAMSTAVSANAAYSGDQAG